jgi:hypothetical protein
MKRIVVTFLINSFYYYKLNNNNYNNNNNKIVYNFNQGRLLLCVNALIYILTLLIDFKDNNYLLGLIEKL